MDNDSLENGVLLKLQKVQLEILNEVIQICNEHGLKYYAIAGTVLGAVRHKGFIPWDDDIDISMPRKDYEQFQEIVSKRAEQNNATPSSALFEIETIYTHESHETPIMKFTDKRVIMISKRQTVNQKIWNAFIDISPMDGLPDNRLLRFLHVRFFLIVRKLFYVANFNNTAEIKNKNKPLIKRLLTWLISKLKLHKLFNARKIAKSGDKMLKKHSFYTAKYCSPQLWGRYKTKAVFPTECIGEGILLPFENIEIRVPTDYKLYLSQIYGDDYMKLPPEQKRISHSSVIIFQNAHNKE